MNSILASKPPKIVAGVLNENISILIFKKFPKDYRGWVYFYCTKGKDRLVHDIGGHIVIDNEHYAYGDEDLNGKVVSRFYCDNVEEIEYYCCDDIYEGYHREDYGTKTLTKEELLKCSCLRECELVSYLSYNKNGELYGYAIHISQLEIFDKPKELWEFTHWKKEYNPYGEVRDYYGEIYSYCLLSLTKAPSNYMYVEAEG